MLEYPAIWWAYNTNRHISLSFAQYHRKRSWREVVEKDCQARKLNKEDATDCSRRSCTQLSEMQTQMCGECAHSIHTASTQIYLPCYLLTIVPSSSVHLRWFFNHVRLTFDHANLQKPFKMRHCQWQALCQVWVHCNQAACNNVTDRQTDVADYWLLYTKRSVFIYIHLLNDNMVRIQCR